MFYYQWIYSNNKQMSSKTLVTYRRYLSLTTLIPSRSQLKLAPTNKSKDERAINHVNFCIKRFINECAGEKISRGGGPCASSLFHSARERAGLTSSRPPAAAGRWAHTLPHAHTHTIYLPHIAKGQHNAPTHVRPGSSLCSLLSCAAFRLNQYRAGWVVSIETRCHVLAYIR